MKVTKNNPSPKSDAPCVHRVPESLPPLSLLWIVGSWFLFRQDLCDSLEEISDLVERKSPARAAVPWGCLVLGQPSFSPLTLSSSLGSCHYRSVQKPGGDRWDASFAEKTSVTISTSCPEAISRPPQGEAPSANPSALHSPPSCKLCPILLRTILKKPVVFLLEIIYNHRKVCEISSNFNHQVTPWSKFLSTRD